MWVQLGGSLVAILVLAGIAWALKLGGGTIGDAGAAIRAAEEATSGFDGVAAAVGSDGKAALVRGRDGRMVLLKIAGARVAARALATPIAVEATGAGLVIDSGDRWFGRVRVAGVGALP